MTTPDTRNQFRRLAAMADQSPAFRKLLERSMTEQGLALLAKYSLERRPWWKRLYDRMFAKRRK